MPIFFGTCPQGPPEATCFQLKRPAVSLQFYLKDILALQPCVIFRRDLLDHLSLPTKYHVDSLYIMLIGPNEQEVATILDSLVTHMNIRGWKISPNKIQGPFTSVKFLRVQWCEACKNILSKEKDKLLYLAPPTTKKAAQHLMGLFGFWPQHIPYLGVLL